MISALTDPINAIVTTPKIPMLFYCLPAGLVLAIALHALLQDCTTPNNHLGSWLFVLLAALLWPITLPSMLCKKYRDIRHFLKHHSHAWIEVA